MSRIPLKLTAVATSCALIGGGAGVVLNANAAKPSKASTTKAHGKKAKKKGAARLLRRAVHADLTVATKDGFKDVTIDRGILKGAVATKLTISESTKKLTGKQVDVDVPSDAKVRVDRKPAHLSDLKAGQRVAVVKLPKKTVVRAFTPKQP